MTAADFALWYAAYQLEPWGQKRDDISRALVGSAIVNCWTKTTVEPEKLMPRYGPPIPEKVRREMAAIETAEAIRRQAPRPTPPPAPNIGIITVSPDGTPTTI